MLLMNPKLYQLPLSSQSGCAGGSAHLAVLWCGLGHWQGWLLQGQEPLLRPMQLGHRGVALHDSLRARLPGVPQGLCVTPDLGLCLFFICSYPGDVSQSRDTGQTC